MTDKKINSLKIKRVLKTNAMINYFAKKRKKFIKILDIKIIIKINICIYIYLNFETILAFESRLY